MPFILRRLGFYLVAAWVALTVNFFLPRAMPGNAVEAIMSKFPNLTPATYHALEAMLGVGHPGSLWGQYVSYLNDVVHFNFGTSVSNYPASVSSLLGQTIPWTLALVGSATVIAFFLGTLLGIFAGWRNGGWLDRLLPGLMFVQALPVLLPRPSAAVAPSGQGLARLPHRPGLRAGASYPAGTGRSSAARSCTPCCQRSPSSSRRSRAGCCRCGT